MGHYLDLLRTAMIAAPSHDAPRDISDKSAERKVRSLRSLMSQPKHCATERRDPPEPSAASDAAMPPTASPPTWGGTEAERAAIVEHDGKIPRVGVPEISEPALLRDGRRLWRFPADAIPERASAGAVALIDQARWCGAVLVADGCELIVVERWLSALSPDTLHALCDQPGEVIAALRQHSRARCARRAMR